MDTPKVNGEPLTILLVEDNPAHAELVMRSFEDHRLANKIHHVADGEVALDYLFRRGRYADPEQSPRPHLVLLDLHLPRIDGLEVLREIRANESVQDLPVVVLTTSAVEGDVVGAYKNHVNSYVVKPVDFDKFMQLMDQLGFYWLAWNHMPLTA